MGSADAGFRDELSAAHARIAALEAQLAARGDGALESKLARLREARVALLDGAERRRANKRAFAIMAAVAVALLVPWALIMMTAPRSALGAFDYLFFPSFILTIVPSVWLLTRKLEAMNHPRRVAALDREIAEVERLLAIEREVHALRSTPEADGIPPERVRVSEGQDAGAPLTRIAAEGEHVEDEASSADSRRGAHRAEDVPGGRR